MSNAEESFNVLPWEIPETKNHNLWNRLNVIKVQDIFFVILWNKHQATVIRVNTPRINEINLSTLKTAPYCQQDITIKGPLLQVFEGPERLLFLTSCGDLAALTFDQLKSFNRNHEIKLAPIHSFLQPYKLLGALTINEDLLLVVKVFNHHIKVDINQLYSSSDDTEVLILFSLPLEIQQEQDSDASCILCVCDKDMSSLLTGIEEDDCKVMLIGSNTGSVFMVPLTKDASVQPEVKKLYHAGRSVYDIISVKDRCCIFILLEGGVVVTLTKNDSKVGNFGRRTDDSGALQFDMFALPSYIHTLAVPVDPKSILCSDGIHCWRIKRDGDNSETLCLPVKGVTSVVPLPGSNICVAVTKHNTFYCIDVDANIAAKNKVEEKSVQVGFDLESPYQYICEFKDQTDTLVNIETSLAVEDDTLEGVSLATRSDFLGTKFSGRILVYNVDRQSDCDEPGGHLPTDIMYKLVIEVKNNSSLKFSAKLWSMSISVTLPRKGVISKTLPLKNSLTQGFPFSTHVYLPLSSEDLAFKTKVLVNLIADLPEPDKGQWISIPVIAEDLCVSYFLSVLTASEKSMFKARTSSIDDQISSLINNDTSNPTKHSAYSIHLPGHLRNVTEVMQLLLSKCRHRCEDYLRLLKGGAAQREVHLLLGDVLVTLSFNQTMSTLTVVSTETKILHSVKAWIIGALGKESGGHCAPPAVIAKAKCIQSLLETEQVKATTDVKNLEAIHSEVRTNISAMLTL